MTAGDAIELPMARHAVTISKPKARPRPARRKDHKKARRHNQAADDHERGFRRSARRGARKTALKNDRQKSDERENIAVLFRRVAEPLDSVKHEGVGHDRKRHDEKEIIAFKVPNCAFLSDSKSSTIRFLRPSDGL
jgi:hypothetical protein